MTSSNTHWEVTQQVKITAQEAPEPKQRSLREEEREGKRETEREGERHTDV